MFFDIDKQYQTSKAPSSCPGAGEFLSSVKTVRFYSLQALLNQGILKSLLKSLHSAYARQNISIFDLVQSSYEDEELRILFTTIIVT